MPVALLSRLAYTAVRKPIRTISFFSLTTLISTSAFIHNQSRPGTPAHSTPAALHPSDNTSPSSSLLSAVGDHVSMFPASTMPELTGRYKTIGVSTFYIQQPPSTQQPEPGTQRTEQQQDERLELVVKAFYPSSTSPAPPPAGAYMTKEQAAAVASFVGIPSFVLAHLARIKVRAVDDADVAKAGDGEAGSSGLPIIVYSHGLGGIPETYTVQACELASRGFVVFMPVHNDRSASVSVLPDGRRIAYESAKNSPSEKEFRSAQLVKRVKELTFLIDHITTADTLPFPTTALQSMPAQLDRSQLALIGHSFGAATVIATASFEQLAADKQSRASRVKAVVSHDQWTLPIHDLVKAVRLRVPTLITISEGFYKWDGNYRPLLELYRSLDVASSSGSGSSGGSGSDDVSRRVMVMIEGSAHSNFSDVGLFNATLTRWAGSIGKIDHERCWAMLDDLNSGWCGRWMGVKGEGEQDVFVEGRAPAEFKFLS